MPKIIIAENKADLRECIKEALYLQGADCDLNHIDISKVTDLSNLFADCTGQPDVSHWEVGHVRDMSGLFVRADYCGDLSAWRPQSLEKATTMLTRHSMREMPKPCFYHWWAAMVEGRVFEPYILEFVHLHAPTMQAVGMSPVQASVAMQEHWLARNGPEPHALALPDLGNC